jgi:predicted nucleic acid-binding Zn ribbon protein
MNPVPMQCPLCAGMIQIDPAHAGQQVGCPLCAGVMLLPPPEFFGLPGGFSAEQSLGVPSQYSLEAPATLLQLGCPICGGPFQVSPEMAGGQVACPHCQNGVSIPDLFAGNASDGLAPPPMGALPKELPRHSLQFIGLPPSTMGGLEIPTGLAVPTMPLPPFGQPPAYPANLGGIPPGTAVAPNPQPAEIPVLPAPMPTQPAHQPPIQVQLDTEDCSSDARLYPPGMAPKAGVRSKKQKSASRAEREKRDPTGESPAEKGGEDSLPRDQAVVGELPGTVDALLPPGAAAADTTSSAVESLSGPKRSVVDTLLPPGAPADSAAVPTEQVALPQAPPPPSRPIPVPAPGRLVLPTPDGDYVTVDNKEGTTTISDRGEEIEIRKLSLVEKTRRRRVKNIVMFTFAILVLVVVIVLMTRK